MKAIEPAPKTWIRRNVGWVALAAAGVLALLASIPLQIWDAQNHRHLEAEFATISPPANVQTIKAFSYTRTSTVGAMYSGNIIDDNLRAHYDEELLRHGWAYAGWRNTAYGDIWNAERTGKEVVYYKGSYTATVKYPGPLEAKEIGYSFEFTIESGWFEPTLRRLTRFLRG